MLHRSKNAAKFNCGIGICRDDECIYVHNKDKPYVCILCGKNLHPDIIHKYCGSKITFNKITSIRTQSDMNDYFI